ncbi:MAG: DUF2085 domain-containing protein [Candidatus Omnitrophota bacterium]
MRYFLRFLFILFPVTYAAVLVFFGLLVPLLDLFNIPFGDNIYKALHFTCHQIPSRSIWIGNYFFGLCARCFSLYLVLSATLSYLYLANAKKQKISLSILLLTPMLIDGVTQLFGFRLSNNIFRVLTGAAAGVGIALILYSIYLSACAQLLKREERGMQKNPHFP